MEKPGNWFATLKMGKKHPKEKKIRKGFASLLKNSLWDSFQFLLMQINVLVSPTQTIKILMGSTKLLHHQKHGVLFH